jgi:HEAT repeat protein
MANDWLKEFAVCLKNVSMYSSAHPRGKDSLARSMGSLEDLLRGRASVTLTCADSHLMVENLPVERDRAISTKIYADLSARNVKSIEFATGVTLEEYAAFVRALLQTPERLHERGGLEAVLLDEGVSSISLNRARVGKITDAMSLLTDLSVMDLLSGRGGGLSEEQESLGNLINRDPSSVAQALASAAASRDRSPLPGNLDFQADQVAISLERLAQKALEENQRPRAEILADLGRIVAASPPPIQARLMAPRGTPRQGRGAVTAAVEQMSSDAIAEVVSTQQEGSEIEYGRLHEALSNTVQWKEDRQATLEVIERRLASQGISPVEAKEILDHLMWAELDLTRKLQLLHQRDHLWRVDFRRVKEVLVKLFGTDQIKEATALIQKYLSGLLVEDGAQRRRVAENARYILQLIEKTGKGHPMLNRIAGLFMTRLQDEPDEEVQSRLSAALAFLADLRLREGETAAVLNLMRRADEMASAPGRDLSERGERLRSALSRAGSEKLFKELADRHLAGDDSAAMEAAEILKHAGVRAVDYLIERLAVEEDRGNRANLVTLLKEMHRSASQAFVARLKDPRWFLVRNVVHILGELGDPSVLPALREIADHGDPRVRKEMVRTYLRLGGPEGEELVVRSLGDPDRAVQLVAVNALSGLGGRESTTQILDLIRRAGSHGSAATELRLEAVAAAGRRKLGDAVEPLADLVTRKGLLGYSEPTELRVAAVQALGMIGGDRAFEVLLTAVREDTKREVREAAEPLLSVEKGAAPA